MIEHTAQYEYNRVDPRRWRVTCTCGWFHYGSRDECEAKFSGHDLEWIKEERVPEWKLRLQEIKGR